LAESADFTATVGIIQSMELVKSISPVRVYSRPATVVRTYNNTRTPDTAALQKRIWKDGKYEYDYPPHVMGNVDKLHAQNIKGQGMTIAIIDTGVDYTHHLLGSGIGPGYKFIYGTDLVGDEYTGDNEAIPDDDPMDCNGHGSHVSGIVGATFSPELRFSGVAPEANFKMFKVFGCDGGVGNDILIQAYQAAAAHGADIITASLGGMSGWPEGKYYIIHHWND
jgi:subtilisin family serine protease